MSNDTPDPDVELILAADEMLRERGGVEGSEITGPGEDAGDESKHDD
jgi:hypothetical protein